MRRFLLNPTLLAFMLMPLAPSAASEFLKIGEDQNVIIFKPAGIQFDEKTFLHSPFKNSGYESRSYIGIWKNAAGPMRKAVILLTQLAPGYVYISKSELRDHIKDLTRSEAGNLTFHQKKYALSKFGGGNAQLFRMGDQNCVGFQQVGGEMSGFSMYVEGTEWLIGYYCQSPDTLTMQQGEKIAKSIAVKPDEEPEEEAQDEEGWVNQ